MFSNVTYRVTALQSLTGKYRVLQGNPCNENRFFPVRIDLQGVPVSLTGFGFAMYLINVDEHYEKKFTNLV